MTPRMIEDTRKYALADGSDPFTFGRCLAHIRQGLCGPCEQPDLLWWEGERDRKPVTVVTRDKSGKITATELIKPTKPRSVKVGPSQGSDGHYTGTPQTEMRLAEDGSAYPVTVYRNVARL